VTIVRKPDDDDHDCVHFFKQLLFFLEVGCISSDPAGSKVSVLITSTLTFDLKAPSVISVTFATLATGYTV